jgi:hypothetical protein
VLVVLAILAATIALGTWWASLLVIRAAGSFTPLGKSDLAQQIGTQLDHLAPGATYAGIVQADIHKALDDPKVTQALATSAPKGSLALSQELTHLDGRLGPILSRGNLLSESNLVSVGQRDLAELAVRLRQIAEIAALAAAAGAAGALLISPLRSRIVRHLAFSASLVGGLALLVSWALPALLAHATKGSAHSVATAILSGGAPVRSVVLVSLIAGGAVYLATHLFGLVPGRGVAYDPRAPVPRGKIV